MARLHDLGNNQMLAEQKWKINSNWLFKLRISGYSGGIYSKPSPSRSTLWIYLIWKLSPILHPTQLICNQNCCFKRRHLICWWILYSSCDLLLFTYILMSTHLTLFWSFWILNLHFRGFSFMLFYFRDCWKTLQDSRTPVVLSYWKVGEGSYPSDLSQTRLGHHSIESQEGLNWKAPHHAFCILHLPLGGHAKSGSTFRKRKAGRCWRWLKGWLETGTLSPRKCVCVYSTTLRTWQVLEIQLDWKNAVGPLLLIKSFFSKILGSNARLFNLPTKIYNVINLIFDELRIRWNGFHKWLVNITNTDA